MWVFQLTFRKATSCSRLRHCQSSCSLPCFSWRLVSWQQSQQNATERPVTLLSVNSLDHQHRPHFLAAQFDSLSCIRWKWHFPTSLLCFGDSYFYQGWSGEVHRRRRETSPASRAARPSTLMALMLAGCSHT